MWGYDKLYDWKAWIVVIVLILLIIAVLSFFFSGDKKKKANRRRKDRRRKRTKRSEPDSESESETESEPEVEIPRRKRDKYKSKSRSRKGRKIDQEPVNYQLNGIQSSHDAVPPVPEVEEIDDAIDLTPALPPHIQPISRSATTDSKGEVASRLAMEKIYGVPFNKDRPSWLINPKTGQRLELDGVNHTFEYYLDDNRGKQSRKVKLAFEYHGRQHYTYVPFFHKSKEDFVRQVERDNVKLKICDSMGYYVITIPHSVPLDKIEDYIRYYDPKAVEKREAKQRRVYRED